MTRAYAAVARGGVAVTPYGIRRVTTADGTLLYQHQDDEPRVLVAPWVAAQMTDLLQGVGRCTAPAAPPSIGRPTAGKTGTTTSNKDGWFIGFSSGLTTGVWMGRDDNRALPGLAGGRAPARAFHDFMVRAVANRPVEAFATDVAGARLAERAATMRSGTRRPTTQPLVDADGNPIEPAPPPRGRPPGDPDEATAARATRTERDERARPARPAIDRRPPRARRPPAPRAATPPRGDRPRADSAARPDAVEGGALALAARRAPAAGSAPSRLATRAWKSRAVVEVDEVRDLVRDGGPADEVGREDQPPAVADRARAPSSFPSATPDRRRRSAPP